MTKQETIVVMVEKVKQPRLNSASKSLVVNKLITMESDSIRKIADYIDALKNGSSQEDVKYWIEIELKNGQ